MLYYSKIYKEVKRLNKVETKKGIQNEQKSGFSTMLRLTYIDQLIGDQGGSVSTHIPINAPDRETAEIAEEIMLEMIDRRKMGLEEQIRIACWAMGKAGCNPPTTEMNREGSK